MKLKNSETKGAISPEALVVTSIVKYAMDTSWQILILTPFRAEFLESQKTYYIIHFWQRVTKKIILNF